ncbi:BglG family transcription antiterminator [Enterococcus ratti]|uniref:Transcription antiterminator BglG n=1 Tax=Enterococcus ratti TaxID=150033 RepID=A0A1L8WG80_9ENTE|nr:HTH domain-containing protein [Enterococcus ratti]OJG80033.1 transcription antiterminator BglG [Enterococcus ratti]
MTLVNRWYQVLKLLVDHKEMNLQDLQEKLIASPQTVRKSIDTLNDELIGIAKIIQKESLFQLEIRDFEEFEIVLSGRLKKEADFNSSSKRVSYIIKRLIEADHFISTYDLSEELAVSRGTVNKDIKRMKELVRPWQVSVIGRPNRGIYLKGKEFDLRLLHVNEVQEYFEEEFLQETTKQVIQKVIKETKLAKQDSFLLPRVISIVLQRVLAGQMLTELPREYVDYVSKNEYIEELMYHLEITYNVTLSHWERSFISFPFNVNTNHVRNTLLTDDQLLYDYFQKMMMKIHRYVVVELDEAFLFSEMKEHLMNVMNRLIFHVECHDLFYGEIERHYPFAYELAKISLQELGRLLHRTVPSVEYGYLALYFELALRGNYEAGTKKEIAVICSTGHGTALMIQRQLEKVLGANVQISHFSEEECEKKDLNQYFAVFTTIPLKNIRPQTPIIHMTNLFNDAWLRNEWKRVKEIRSIESKNVQMTYQLLDRKEEYHTNIQKMITKLEKEKLVDSTFARRIFAREDQQTTIFESGIAFPHAVNRALTTIILSIGVFEESLNTSKGKVDVVLLLGIPEKLSHAVEAELLHLYDRLFTIAGDENLCLELRKQKDILAVKEWMQRKGVIT